MCILPKCKYTDYYVKPRSITTPKVFFYYALFRKTICRTKYKLKYSCIFLNINTHNMYNSNNTHLFYKMFSYIKEKR